MREQHIAKDAVDAAETAARWRNLVPQPATVENKRFLADLRQLTVNDVAPDPGKNRLLAALPVTDWQRWLPQLKAVEMPKGQVLFESGSLPTHVYFPTTAIVSLLYVMENGASAGTAVVGNEGVVGVSLFMGGGSTPSRAVVQSAGQGFRMKGQAMKSEFNQSPPVLHLLLRYTQALITQMAQTAACNRHHSVDKQLCRWLLLSLDRLPGNEIIMTQELIANMLGVRREGVTAAALKLQESGLIRYARGHITVLDRKGLEKCTCECYATVKQEYDRLLPCVGGGAIRSLAAGQPVVCTRTVGNARTPRASVPGSAAVVVRSVIHSGRLPCFSTPLSSSLSP